MLRAMKTATTNRPGRPRESFAAKVRRAARPHETAGEVAARLMRFGASFLDTARYLEERGYRTPRGSLHWSPKQVAYEWMKYRAAKGKGVASKRLAQARQAMILATDDFEEIARMIQTWEATGRSATTYRLRVKPTTVREKALAEWWKATEAARQRGEPGPAEPRFDSRGRPLKGRRFSRVKRPEEPGRSP